MCGGAPSGFKPCKREEEVFGLGILRVGKVMKIRWLHIHKHIKNLSKYLVYVNAWKQICELDLDGTNVQTSIFLAFSYGFWINIIGLNDSR